MRGQMTTLGHLYNRPIAACLALLLAAAATGPATAAAAAGRVQDFSVAVNAASQPLLTPTVATLSGRQVLYEVPVGPVHGTLAFFHGCAHNATASWPRQAACPACNGAAPAHMRSDQLNKFTGGNRQLQTHVAAETQAYRRALRGPPAAASTAPVLQACQRRSPTPSRSSPVATP